MPPVKTKLVNLRVSLGELEGWRECARVEGLSLSAWIRLRCSADGVASGLVRLEPPKQSRLDAVGVPASAGVGKASRPSIDVVLADPRLAGRVFRGPDFKGGRR